MHSIGTFSEAATPHVVDRDSRRNATDTVSSGEAGQP